MILSTDLKEHYKWIGRIKAQQYQKQSFKKNGKTINNDQQSTTDIGHLIYFIKCADIR